MKEPAHRSVFGLQIVVPRHSVFSLQYMRLDACLLKVAERFRLDLKPLIHASRENDDLCPVIQEFLDVSRLNAGTV
jgi:hypothetical protein